MADIATPATTPLVMNNTPAPGTVNSGGTINLGNYSPQGAWSENYNNLNRGAPSGFSSSMQPMVNNQASQAASSAMSSLSGNGPQPQQPQQPQPGSSAPTSSPTPSSSGGGIDINGFMQGAMNMIQSSTGQQMSALSSSYGLQLQNAALANQGIQLQYNTALGGLSQQYNQAFQQLQTQHMNSIGSAVSQMALADPMGVQSSSFASGYIGKINDLYSQQTGFLNAAYGQQQTALQNGQAQAALQIQQQINSAQADFGQKVAAVMGTQNQAMLGIAQAGIGMAQFQQSRALQSQSNFETALRGTNLTGLDQNASMASLQKQFPNLYTEGQQAGFTPEEITSSIKSGTIAAQNSFINQQRLYAEFGGGGGGSGGGGGGTQNLSDWGKSLGNGGAAIANHPDITNSLTNIISAASPQNLQSLDNYVRDGSSNVFSSSIGPIMNSFFGTNISNTTSDKDIGVALSENLGIPVDLAGLSNQSSTTRAKVLTSILTSLQGKLEAKAQGYAATYNLGGLKGQLDQARTNIQNEITQLKSGAGTPAGLFTAANGAANWGSFMSQSSGSWFSK